MTRIFRYIAILMVLLPPFACAQTSPADAPRADQHRTESFKQKLLRISGISADPENRKHTDVKIVSGEIWLVEIDSMKAKRLVTGGGYRSPVFMPKTNDIFALKGPKIVRLPSTGGAVTTLYAINAVSKLVGFSQDNADELLILRENLSGRPEVGLVSVSTGSVAPVPYDRASSEDNSMLDHLRDWDRVYGDKSVIVKSQTKSGMADIVEWTDVFLKVGTAVPVDVSNCDGVKCGQPSLSADGTWIVFIRAQEK